MFYLINIYSKIPSKFSLDPEEDFQTLLKW